MRGSILVLAAVVGITACSGSATSSSHTTLSGVTVVLTAEYVGGCAMGGPGCPTYQILSDGSYTVTYGPLTDASLTQRGTIDSTVVAELSATAEATNLTRLLSSLQPGQCMAPVDGIDITYIWHIDDEAEALSTCDYTLDGSSDLMRLTNALIGLIDQDLAE